MRRQALPARIPQLILVHGFSPNSFHTNDDPLTSDLVGNPQRHYLGDTSQLTEHGFDLRRIHSMAMDLEKRATSPTEMHVTTNEIHLITSGQEPIRIE